MVFRGWEVWFWLPLTAGSTRIRPSGNLVLRRVSELASRAAGAPPGRGGGARSGRGGLATSSPGTVTSHSQNLIILFICRARVTGQGSYLSINKCLDALSLDAEPCWLINHFGHQHRLVPSRFHSTTATAHRHIIDRHTTTTLRCVSW
jgi:hypothetical protein